MIRTAKGEESVDHPHPTTSVRQRAAAEARIQDGRDEMSADRRLSEGWATVQAEATSRNHTKETAAVEEMGAMAALERTAEEVTSSQSEFRLYLTHAMLALNRCCRRRAQREASTVTIWPPSPKAPSSDSESNSDAERRHRKKRKKDKKHSSSSKKRSSKRYSDDDDSSDSDSEDDSRRRSSKKSKKSKRSSKYSEDDEDRRKRKEKKQSRSSRKQRDRSRSRSRDRVRNEQEDEWAEKGASSKAPAPGDGQLAVAAAPADKVGLTSLKGKSKETIDGNDTSDDDDVGPKPLQEAISKTDAREYGGALLRGEGEAMAAFVADGQRIPRRGEIGLESHEIEKFENAGFVMSGSRHRRMNAVRIRKENQVISAEEKRGILKLQKDEQAKKEAMIVGSFKELVERRLEGERKANAKRQASQDAE